jgi:hypothetical protein
MSRFRAFVAVAFLVLATSSAVGLPASQEPAPPARAGAVVVQQRVKDLGIVGLGTDPEAAFTIENRGASAIEISVAPVALGLRIVDAARTIAPSASGAVRVAVDTFRAGVTTEWKIEVTTSDPATPTVELTVKADVRNFLTIEPATARFNFVQYGPEGGTTHVISAQDDAPLEVLGVDAPADFITAAFRELKTPAERVADLPGRQWRIDLTIKGDAAVGPIDGYAIVRTNHPRQPRAFVPVTGFVRPLFAVTPPSIMLSAPPEAGERPFATLVIKNFGEPDLEITKASSDIAGLRATIVPVDAGHSWRVELRRDAATASGAWSSGTLRLMTTHPKVRELTVPVRLREGAQGADAARAGAQGVGAKAAGAKGAPDAGAKGAEGADAKGSEGAGAESVEQPR